MSQLNGYEHRFCKTPWHVTFVSFRPNLVITQFCLYSSKHSPTKQEIRYLNLNLVMYLNNKQLHKASKEGQFDVVEMNF